MRISFLLVSLATVTLVAAPQPPQPVRLPATGPAPASYPLDGAFLPWPLPSSGQAYADIDGKHLGAYVVEQAAISRRCRDQGHRPFWGRITWTSADAESADWLAGHFKRIGLSDVRIQPIDLPPQWMPQSWTITATSGATKLPLDRSAAPAYGTPETGPGGLDVDAVWAGTGSDADVAGRDVRGKAVFVFSMALPGSMNNTSTLEGGPNRGALFAKTALAINAEHMSTFQTYFYGERIRRAITSTAQLWHAGGPTRPKLQDIAIRAFSEFGVSTYAEPEQTPPPGDLGRFCRFVPDVDAGDFTVCFHADEETPETVPWTGLEASTRVYARIIDGVNALELKDLQRAPEPEPGRGHP